MISTAYSFIKEGGTLKKLNNNKGFTLVEMVIVITIIAVLGAVLVKGAGWVGTSKVSAAAQQAKTLRDGTIAFKTLTAAANYTGISAAELTNRNLTRPADTTSPWGGTNVVAANATPAKVDITIAGAPDASACTDTAKIVNSFYGTEVVIKSGATTVCTGGACATPCAAAGDVVITFDS